MGVADRSRARRLYPRRRNRVPEDAAPPLSVLPGQDFPRRVHRYSRLRVEVRITPSAPREEPRTGRAGPGARDDPGVAAAELTAERRLAGWGRGAQPVAKGSGERRGWR